jgi:hypothetical protein
MRWIREVTFPHSYIWHYHQLVTIACIGNPREQIALKAHYVVSSLAFTAWYADITEPRHHSETNPRPTMIVTKFPSSLGVPAMICGNP